MVDENTWLIFELLASLLLKFVHIKRAKSGALSSHIDIEHVR